jgi:hypothetical protein
MGAPQAVLISESFAQRKFPGQDPLGQRFASAPTLSGRTGDGARLLALWAM